MKIGIITQARTGSQRLPKKVLKKINHLTFLEIHLKRIIKSKLAKSFIVATTKYERDNIISEIAKNLKVDVFRGSENDVLDRYYKAAKKNNLDVIVRVTSDCPLIDPNLIDKIIYKHILNKKDFTSNITKRTFPDGLDVEVFNFETLKRAWVNSKKLDEREHVTYYIWKNRKLFSSFCYENSVDYSKYRLTLDYPEDLELFKKLINKIGYDKPWMDYVYLLENDKQLCKINSTRINN